MKRVIVTGGTGFIGSWLIQELLENQIEVTAVVRDRSRLPEEILCHHNCTIVEKPVERLTGEEFDPNGAYEAFFHLGWAGVSSEYKNEVELQLNNINMSLHALDICSRIRCGKFLAAGTVAEYVFCEDIMDVNAKQSPNDMYGAAKVSAHYFLEVRARQLGQPFIWLVIPSTFGERRDDNNIITYTIRTLLKGEKPRYGHLEQMWDFLYVAEVVRAIRLIGELGRAGRIYGIGSGKYMPLRVYIEKIRDLIDPALDLGIGELPAMSERTFSSCVNINELTEDTGFYPRIGFEEGIIKTIAYLKEKGIGCDDGRNGII